jgi:inosose dehydratase
MTEINRRQFVQTSAVATAGLALADGARVFAAPGDIKFGYAAITWQGQDRQAIDDVAAVGFKGIQLRASVLTEFGDTPAVLKALLAERGIAMVCLSSGNVRIEPEFEADDVATHTRNARFVRDAGGQFLQLIDSRPKRALVAADYAHMGRLINEIGKRTADIGVPVVYHHHMNSVGERPDEIDRVLDQTDARHVKLLLDVAHYQQGGGDPVAAVRKYADRISLLHIKDLQSPLPGNTGDPMRSYRFVELGRGQVDLKGVFAALAQVKYRGWAIVELDAVPDKARTPKESAIIAKRYLETLGFTV